MSAERAAGDRTRARTRRRRRPTRATPAAAQRAAAAVPAVCRRAAARTSRARTAHAACAAERRPGMQPHEARDVGAIVDDVLDERVARGEPGEEHRGIAMQGAIAPQLAQRDRQRVGLERLRVCDLLGGRVRPADSVVTCTTSAVADAVADRGDGGAVWSAASVCRPSASRTCRWIIDAPASTHSSAHCASSAGLTGSRGYSVCCDGRRSGQRRYDDGRADDSDLRSASSFHTSCEPAVACEAVERTARRRRSRRSRAGVQMNGGASSTWSPSRPSMVPPIG